MPEIDFGMPSWAAIEADAKERGRVEAAHRHRQIRAMQWVREDRERAAKEQEAARPTEARKTLRYRVMDGR